MIAKLEKEIVEFYLIPSSAREVERKYGINLYQLKKLLTKYNIQTHSRSTVYRLRDDRTKVVCLEKYGVTNPFAAECIKEKIKQSMIDRHGVEHVGQASISKQKTKEAFLNKYGVDSYTKTEEFKKNYAANVAEYKIKEFKTKKLNRTFNTSKAEESYYKFLVKQYGKANVVRQYSEERYPYHCDFYIRSKDLFIELNLNWTHGGHPFNTKDQADLAILAKWEKRAKKSDYYKNAIETWTIRDVAKIATAKENKLNYLIYYKESELFEQYSRFKCFK